MFWRRAGGCDTVALTPMEMCGMCHGLYPGLLNDPTEIVLTFLDTSLPTPPVSTAASLSCAAAAASAGHGGVDRISALPDEVLLRVVSRLPAKDGARTAALSKRWAHLWRSAPLVLVDAHLLPAAGAGGSRRRRLPSRRGAVSRALRDAVSAALGAHPGPFPFVSLTCGFMEAVDADRAVLARWFLHLATKGVEELVLVNRPFPIPGLRLPAALFSCPSLRSLFLCSWEFPDTALLPRGASFPNLLELILGCVVMKDRDLDFVLAASPVLETLAVIGSPGRLTARLASHSLRCAQFGMTELTEVSVVDAPCLERLIVWNRPSYHPHKRKTGTRIKIGHAPQLTTLGYLEPGEHVLEIGNTIIKAGTKASPKTIVPSVRMLAVHLHFGISSEVKMLSSFLRCFPNVETLCVESVQTCEPTANLSHKFWQETGPIECVQSHLKILSFREFSGEQREMDFLMFIAKNTPMLQRMNLVLRYDGACSTREEMNAKLRILESAKWACGRQKIWVVAREFGGGFIVRSLKAGCDFTYNDPFKCL